jgi:hypothetical protein
VTAQEHPRAIFKRAIECGNLVIAEATAHAQHSLVTEEAKRENAAARARTASAAGRREGRMDRPYGASDSSVV